MRMPDLADLDSDQRDVYVKAPMDGAVLVTGPPGTGKTVVAFHRAVSLRRFDDQPATIIMFNKVLRQYTQSVQMDHDVQIEHFHGWYPNWFKSSFGKAAPKKEKYVFDFLKAKQIVKAASKDQLSKAHWGHLIIDEGQDFAPELYEFLKFFIDRDFAEENKPTLTVFADDNQTIHDQCSMLKEIQFELDAQSKDKRFWRLEKNYRNSRSIALFARKYQLLKRGAAKLPDEDSSRKPDVMFFPNRNTIAKRIANQAKNSRSQIGVISFGGRGEVKAAYTELVSACDEVGIKAPQMYTSDSRSIFNDATKLDFQDDSSITVLHVKSSKGLEFDNVIVLNMHLIYGGHLSEEAMKELYVVSSRARSVLMFNFPCFSEHLPAPVGLMPAPDENVCKFSAFTDWKDELDSKLAEIDWITEVHLREQMRAKALANEIVLMEKDQLSKLFKLSEKGRFAANFSNLLIEGYEKKDVQSIAEMVLEISPESVDAAINSETK